jgi:hypothetical protein
VGLEQGPLSLVSITEELLWRSSSGSGQENREYDPGGFVALTTQHPLSAKVGTTSPRSGGRHSLLADQSHGVFLLIASRQMLGQYFCIWDFFPWQTSQFIIH